MHSLVWPFVEWVARFLTDRLLLDGERRTCPRCSREGLQRVNQRDVRFIHHDASKQRRLKSASKTVPGLSNDTRLTKLDDTAMICHLKRVLYDLPPGDDGGIGDWVGLAAHDRPGDLAFNCLLSMSQSFYGIFRKATPFAVRGRRLYGECLALVNRNLRDVKKQKSNDTLRSVVVLGAYEVCAFSYSMVNFWLIESSSCLRRILWDGYLTLRAWRCSFNCAE